jgi:ATP-binding cassette subfamily C (CFTR/MRP) protein 1
MALSLKPQSDEAHIMSALDDELSWHAVYSTLIAISFLLFSTFRLWQLRGSTIKIKPCSSSHIKIVCCKLLSSWRARDEGLTNVQVIGLAFSALQMSDLIKASIGSSGIFDAKLFSRGVSFVAALFFCILSFVEHLWSATPSTLLILYILGCLLGHGVELLFLLPKVNKESLYLPITHTFLELGLLLVECHSKEDILLPHYIKLTPEESSGILERTFFWWINPILFKGYQSALTAADLPGVGEKLSSKSLRRNVLRTWDQRGLHFTSSIMPLQSS